MLEDEQAQYVKINKTETRSRHDYQNGIYDISKVKIYGETPSKMRESADENIKFEQPSMFNITFHINSDTTDPQMQ